MRKLAAFCAFCAAALGLAFDVSAQPALERLEKEVRRQLEKGAHPGGPASQPSESRPSSSRTGS
jgi:hypothetical protein